MTSPVELIKCLEAIKENALYASEYPVIITFEDHLDYLLQAKVAQMVNKTFGEMLFPGTDFQEFPSPESLKRRILISTKPPKESCDSLKEEENSDQKFSGCRNKSGKSLGNGGGFRKRKVYTQDKKNEMEEEEEEGAISEYRYLIFVHKVKGKGGLGNLLKGESKRAVRLSLGEQKLQNAVKTNGPDIIWFTQKNLLRVYPKGTRILSSNYHPIIGWTHGVQMVAFNMQGYGKYLWTMQGMFRANGGCGYVKKTDFLLNVGQNNEVFNRNITRQVKQTLKVKVYMGDGWHLEFRRTHSDAFSPPDFFVKLQILGVSVDNNKVKTKPIEDE